MGDSQQQTICLHIKTPSNATEDVTVDGVYLKWTVKELKTHLSVVYPTKPAVNDQRLIYAGKLLPDHLHVKDLFRQADSVLTLHLVCAIRTPPHGEQTQSHSSGPTIMPVQTPSTPELRQRRAMTTEAAPASPSQPQTWTSTTDRPGPPQITQPAFPTYSLYSPQQLLWFQQVYARQYYMQYQAALAAAGTIPSAHPTIVGQYPPVPAHQVHVPAPIANPNPIDNLPANQNPAPDGAFMNAGAANQNLRMNAQGGPVMEDEDDMDTDWLDWLYSAARFGVLLMIIYFNSNLSRFLLVMSTLLLMYLHNAGWFPFRRRMQVQGPNPLQAPEVQHNQQNENRDQNQDLNVGEDPADIPTEELAEGPGVMTAVLVAPHRVSIMWTAWVFFKTFFSSLIPEGQRGVAN
ncbi:homocysteine-responsive endoplasmic reticulum-resident ubiquitin-like domain member 1 protein isoform X2 [Gouania willdenowi]|uniref:Ubiquitin-like domain-containing protein n=2 Tax=Gouania willdenowi TaxID=441366 RepID=A0A8C5G7P0_GOUWI|nr:homocysteine-responsive endoplasmic reticulum-resident ubiquitin-like domain member 1 protein isoform X2 [Gouania willdenowi]